MVAERESEVNKQHKSILCLLACGAVFAACIGISAVLFLQKEGAPAQLDFGTSAGSWASNETGFYFNDAGEPITAAVQKGIDVSKYQGEIDWQKAAQNGVQFAILRCGIGSEWNGEGDVAEYTQDDVQWRANADACTRLGLPFGTYLYSYATTEQAARSEADHVARLLGLIAPQYEGLQDYTASPYQLSLPVYYDLEDKKITGLYPQEAAALVTAFFDQLAKDGYTGEQGIYASLNWVRGRLQDSAFDPWRENLWIARYASNLNYTGTVALWQSTYEDPGEAYGVQSATVDVDFRLEQLAVTGVESKKAAAAEPTFTNDTKKNELWMPAVGDKAVLQFSEPKESDGGQKVYESTSDQTIATVDRKGVVTAKKEGTCTLTATLADGRKSVTCTVRVGSVTVPVFATGALAGDTTGLENIAALKEENPDAILVDTGGSLQGTARASLTGGMDLTCAFSEAGYDVQTIASGDLAYGTERLLADAASAMGPYLAANLCKEDGTVLFDRVTCWNRCAISNGKNKIVQEAGKRIGFFALSSTGSAAGSAALTVQDALQTASEQAAALKAEGADAILCLAAADMDPAPLLDGLQQLGVTAVLWGGAQSDLSGALPVVGAGLGPGAAAEADLVFAPDGTVSCQVQQKDAAALVASSWSAGAESTRQEVQQELLEMADEDDAIRGETLFTLEESESDTVTFGNYVAGIYQAAAAADAEHLPQEAAQYGSPAVLAGGTQELTPGDITRGALESALPTGERLQLVLTTGAMYGELLERGNVSETYEASRQEKDVTDGPMLLVTDTATLHSLSDQNYTVLRDYGDVYWTVRMAISDATGAFTQSFALPEAG
jgi:2',3'-cyclic-nucleotide 2'-phosphodiesterase (5'-nucleotidase family)/GH25 family lysozyme M1 (1,4-beta-N-acetylmuramidase)